jgi:uncharacterized protein YbaR (Trm112 family)
MNNKVGPIKYTCTQCNEELVEVYNTLKCNKCGKAWTIKENIPIFFECDFYQSRTQKTEIGLLLEIINEHGFDESFTWFEKNYPELRKYIFSTDRCDWRFYIPLRENSVMLDISYSLGGIAFTLAQAFPNGYLHVLETRYENAKFIDLRKRRENLFNITQAVTSINTLPFSTESFDLIILEDSLERLKRVHNTSPLFPTFRKLYSLLKTDGYLYVGLKRNFSVFSPTINYKKMLEQSGFKKIDFYLAYPDYKNPTYIIPYNSLGALRYVLKNIATLKNLNTFEKSVVKVLSNYKFGLRSCQFLFKDLMLIAEK